MSAKNMPKRFIHTQNTKLRTNKNKIRTKKCFWVLTNGIKNVKIVRRLNAGVAQLVEQLIRNQQVTGSSPVTSSNERERHTLSFSF